MSASAVGVSSYGEAQTTSAIVAESVTGSHVLQIQGFSMTKGHGNGKSIRSSKFWLGGHRWYIIYYPGGNAQSAGWISIFLRQQRYSTDAALDVKARFTMRVVDHKGESVPGMGNSSLIQHTFTAEEPSWGFPKFVRRNELEESSCVRDDWLRVRFDVTVSTGIRKVAAAATRRVAVPLFNLHRDFGRLLSGAVGADVTFEVAGEVFAAHRCVLAARSPVFMAELFGPMKEKAGYCIRIEDMEARVFKAMLHFIYTDTMPDIAKRDAFVVTQDLLVAADRYDIERLKLICEDKLCNGLDTSNVVTTLALAGRHGCHGLRNACIEFLKPGSRRKFVTATKGGFDYLTSSSPSLIKKLRAKLASVLK